MVLPIYQSDDHKLPQLDRANKGLRFERFFNKYKFDSTNIDVDKGEKVEFLLPFTYQPCGEQKKLDTVIFRQLDLTKVTNGDFRVYHLDGKFVTGIGNAHPLENGFTWHYTLGVPYLHGSQVKGLVRSLIEQYYDGEDKASILMQWFGSEDKKSPDNQAGELIFFDALPIERPQLSVDVMTPHMKDWYLKGGEISKNIDSDNIDQISTNDTYKIPADWHSPVPHPFLSVKRADFLFAIGKRPESKINISDVFECLDYALSYLGAGAKTQTGLGYMSRSDEKTAELKIEKKRQDDLKKLVSSGASALHQELLKVSAEKNWETANDVVKQNFTGQLKNVWLSKLEENPNEHECINELFRLANIHYEKQIKKPNDKKVKPHQREWIKRLLELKEQV